MMLIIKGLLVFLIIGSVYAYNKTPPDGIPFSNDLSGFIISLFIGLVVLMIGLFPIANKLKTIPPQRAVITMRLGLTLSGVVIIGYLLPKDISPYPIFEAENLMWLKVFFIMFWLILFIVYIKVRPEAVRARLGNEQPEEDPLGIKPFLKDREK